MPRLMAFSMTTPQMYARRKRVTRRNWQTWKNLSPGDTLMAVEKVMGLQKGQKVVQIDLIVVQTVWVEPLDSITPEDVILEGFPDWTPEQFIRFYIQHGGGEANQPVRRIAFDFLYPQRFVQLSLFE